ncbi:MAG: VOC family protein [Chloroflexota bacterium]|nr:VOC family protein [Chloroflexota bacterium]
MATVSTYLNFDRRTEEAFNFYKSVFGTEFMGPIVRMGDIPAPEGEPAMSGDDKRLVANVALPILGGHLLMGTDTAATGSTVALNQGNNVWISLHPESREEADTLFASLSEGGNVEMPMADQFWGDYFGSLVDRFGVNWMVNYSSES